MKVRSRVTLSLVALVTIALAQSAAATFVHGNFAGTNVDFNGVQETTQSAGDPEPLFGTPTVTGNIMTFDPPAYNASTNGAFGFDEDHATLQMDVVQSSVLDTIESILITEVGDATLSGPGAGAGTGVFLSMSGTIRINATDVSGAIAPLTVGWSGTFDTGSFFDAITNPGTTLWTGTALIDVTQILIDNGYAGELATDVTLSYNNQIQVFSEALASATVQKKAVDGPAVTIEIIPEPGTAALLGLGLLGMGIRSRRARA
ncbi:MAG: PEP-CTERM sorting domain-containing protein [Myxococcota bacterium]